MVKVLRPQTIEQAAESACLQELVVTALLKKQRQQLRGMVAGASNLGGKGYSWESVKVYNGSKNVVGSSSVNFGEQLREQMRLVGLYFRYGDKYHPRHQCKRQILLLEGDEENELGEAKEEDCEDIGEEDNGEISIHALKGVANNKIIKVEEQVKGCNLMILIDNGP